MNIGYQAPGALVHIQPQHLPPETRPPHIRRIIPLVDEARVIERVVAISLIPQGQVEVTIRTEIQITSVVIVRPIHDGQQRIMVFDSRGIGAGTVHHDAMQALEDAAERGVRVRLPQREGFMRGAAQPR